MCHPLFARGLSRYGSECTCSSRGGKEAPRAQTLRRHFISEALHSDRPAGPEAPPPYDPRRVLLSTPNQADEAFFYIFRRNIVGSLRTRLLELSRSGQLSEPVGLFSFVFFFSHFLTSCPPPTKRAACPETHANHCRVRFLFLAFQTHIGVLKREPIALLLAYMSCV